VATTRTRARGRLRLRLVARGPDGSVEDVELDASPDSSQAEVVSALAHELGLPAPTETAVCRRTAVKLEGETPLGAANLAQGDELLLGSGRLDGAVVAPPYPRLRVVGGVFAGREAPLPPGEHSVGRDAHCAIAIDDPSLSSVHLELTVAVHGGVTIVDAGSRNGTSVEGEQLVPGQPRPLAAGEVVQAGRTLLSVAAPSPPSGPSTVEPDGRIPLNRPPRVRRTLEDAVRPFPAPPGDPQRSRLPLGASLIPLALGIALYLVTRFPMMLMFAALSPLMAVSTFVEDRRSGKKGFVRQRREYRRKLASLRDELARERARETAVRRESSPSPSELLERARRLEPSLWDRRPGDADFLALRLGNADEPAHLTVKLDAGGSEELRREAEKLASWYARVPCMPVVAELGEVGVVGLCGPESVVDGLARWLVAQAAALHSPRDLVLVAALAEERLDGWDWLKWLPHVRSETTPLALHLTVGRQGARSLLEALRSLVGERRREAEGAYGVGARRSGPAVLLVLDEDVAPERPLVAEVLGEAAEHGVAAIWLGRERRDLPGDCDGIVEVAEGTHRLSYTSTTDGAVHDDVTPDGLGVEHARELALRLAPVRDTSAARAGGVVPERSPLLDVLGVEEPIPAWVGARWDAEADTLGAPVGVSAAGPFRIDLRRDGPHALVAGTTGAGKSELLQTLIASLAAAHPPTRLTFLLVDYKGGAAFKDCVDLPHTVGLVTDLDGHLAQRALVSLNAELRRRERILADAAAKDLPDMERRDPERAPASLAIVIDEFAALAREVPDFVEGVVDVAQRGRSLGLHLVLATQRPSGVVSENIRANTNLRMALRVNEPAESSDVIGAPDAARIARDRPGRAFARTGHGELTELQTAYAGGVSRREADGGAGVVVRPFRFEREREPLAPGASNEPGAATDLGLLVDAIGQTARDRELRHPLSPWLPPLEALIPLASLPDPDSEGRDASALAALGLLDEPQRQRQRPYVVDLESEGSVLVYGASGAGKTALLRTLACSLAARSAPGSLQLYGLDFATRGLLSLEALPHCGSVVPGDDQERVTRLFAFLRRTLERRKVLFAQRGAFTLSEYRRAGGDALPRIVVLLDGYAGFAAAFERVNLGELVEALPRLVADGRPLGVHFAITADRRGAVPNALGGIVPTKVVLRMADEDEYAALGVPLKSVRNAHLPPGRGFLAGGLELQCALVGDDPTGEGHGRAVRALADELAARHRERAPAIEPLPTRLERDSLPSAPRPLTAVLGVGDAELEPVTIELAGRHFLVVGPYRSGRSTALETLVRSLRGGTPELELHLLAPRRSPLVQAGVWDSIAEGVEACEAAARTFQEELAGRANPVVVVVDDGEELAESLEAAALELLVRRGRDSRVRVLAAAERQAAQRAFGGWLRELRKEEHGLLLDPDPDVDGEILGARLPRRTNPVFPPGRGYLVERGVVELVQVATARETE
jgi:DNA segregation ATPase FtsK/SpoIIIE, S-DNA-T family